MRERDHRTIASSIVNGALKHLNLRLVYGVSRGWSHPKTPEIKHTRIVPNATYSPWLNDESFSSVYRAIQHNTLVDIYRCYELWQLAEQCAEVEGDFLEVGVWRGGTGCLLATCASRCGKTMYLADTFAGVVKAEERDTVFRGGEHADTSIEIVKGLASAMNLRNISILPGVFPEDTGSQVPGKLALVHCDVDTYRSGADLVAWALPRLSVGGVMIFDDYGFSACEGITRLVNELRQDHSLRFVYNLNGHGLLFKS